MTKLYNRPMNFFEKLSAGWWWFGECWSAWCYTMFDENGEEFGDFFCHLQSDYVRYEQEMYYQDTF